MPRVLQMMGVQDPLRIGPHKYKSEIRWHLRNYDAEVGIKTIMRS